jgi:hypothetical protein
VDEELRNALIQLIHPLWKTTDGSMGWEEFFDIAASRLDVKTGAPRPVRERLSVTRRPEDRLSFLQNTYPGAVPYKSNFVVWDPETKAPVLVDEKGFSLRDLVDMAPIAAEVAGGIMGAAGAAITGAGLPAVGVAAGAGAAGGRALADYTFGAQRTVPQAMRDTAMDVGLNTLGEGAGQGLARLAARRAGRRAAVAGAAQRTGVPVTRGQASGSRAQQGLEEGISRFPGSNSIMADFVEEQERAMVQLSDDIGTALRGGGDPATVARANASVQSAARRMAGEFEETRALLENTVENLVGPDRPIQPTATLQALEDLKKLIASAPETAEGFSGPAMGWLSKIESDVATQGAIPFGVLRKARTFVNEAANFVPPGGSPTPGSQYLKSVAEAMTQDLDGAAQAASPEAHRAWRGLNHFIRSARDEGNMLGLDTITKVMGMDGDIKAYRWAMGEGGVQGSRRLAALRQTFTPDEWRLVASATWDNLGRPRAGMDWTPGTFLRNWQKLDATARRALFGGTEYAAVQQQIDDLVLLAGVRQGSQRMVNHSNTASSLLNALLMGGGAASLLTPHGGKLLAGAAMGAGASGAAAKAFTNQRFLTAAAQGVRVLDRAPNTLPAVLARMGAALADDPTTSEWFSQTFGHLIQ